MPSRDSTDNKHTDRPCWDSSPTTLTSWLERLEQHLLGQDSNYRLLWEQRTVMYRSSTFVVNATHARLLITDKYPTDHSFAKPAPATVAFDGSLTPIVAPTADAATPASIPGSPAPALGTTPLPQPSPGTPIDYSQRLTPDEAREYTIGPRHIGQVDSQLLEDILLCIPDLIEKKDRRALAKCSGTTLLAKFHEEATKHRKGQGVCAPPSRTR